MGNINTPVLMNSEMMKFFLRIMSHIVSTDFNSPKVVEKIFGFLLASLKGHYRGLKYLIHSNIYSILILAHPLNLFSAAARNLPPQILLQKETPPPLAIKQDILSCFSSLPSLSVSY